MADADFTLTSDTWWSTNPAAAGDGSSFAQRKAIPTGVGTGILNMVVNANVNFTLVLEVQSGAIVLGNNVVAAKTFTCNGGFYTVDGSNNPIHPGNTCAYRCAIGGTTGYKEAQKYILGIGSKVANIDFGQDSAGNPTSDINYGLNVASEVYLYNCSNKEYRNYRGGLISGIWEKCTFYGTNSGASYCFGILAYSSITLIDCTVSTSGANWLYALYFSQAIKIIGSLTVSGGGGSTIYIGAANSMLSVQFYRLAHDKVTTDGTTALTGAAFSAYEATGGVDMPLTSGITTATGLAYPLSPTIYNRGIWCLQKVETYIRTTAGAMTWGTPTSTVTYGNYTHTFSKSGYVTQTQTHDFTDGNDWGTVGSPIAITMVANTTNFLAAGGLWGDTSSEDIWKNIRRVTAYPSTATIYDFLIAADAAFVVPTGGLTVYLYDYSGNLVGTLWQSTAPISLVGGGTYQSLTVLKGSALSFTTPATAGKYKMVVEIYDPARPLDYMWEEEWIEILAASSNPTITSPAISAASITQAESAIVTCTSETGNTVTLYIGTKAYLMTESTSTHYTLTLYGLNYAAATYPLKIVAENATHLIDTDETLSIIVTDTSVEAVQHIYNIINANWNAGTVTKPTLIIGGTPGHDDTRDGDLIKFYRSPRPSSRKPRARYSYETRTEYVQLSIHTSYTTPRDRLNDLQKEITRILDSVATSPGGGYTRLWVEYPDVRKESSKHFWAVVDVAVDKIYTVVAT